ncbi:EamA family transporter [Ancylobacter pratisalsi]|uniref:EamA family transporter n=1 Tax=Ancylobacter pratisalsi TaxID=1745854 RepID=A0A6P1YRP6_9HYPH|nr:EamA family transporter [Ancylobacter pratisalsi]
MPRELALLLLLSTLWGASYSFIKIGVETIPPLTFMAGRTLLAGAVLLAVLQARGLRLPADRATWRMFLIQACLNSVLPFTLIAWAETRLDAGLAVILNATTPIFAFLIALLIGRREGMGVRKLFGVASGLAGACLTVGAGALHGLGGDVLPQLAVLAATLCYGGGALFGARFRGLDPMMPAAGSMICGAALLLPASFAFDRPWTLSPSTGSLLALVALALFSTALAFVLFFHLVQTLGSLGATAQAYLRVPIGVGISVVFLGEALPPTAWLGLIAVVAGVIAMTWPARSTGTRPASPPPASPTRP